MNRWCVIFLAVGMMMRSHGALILHYEFEGDLTDSSPSANHAVASGAVDLSNAPGKPIIGSGAAVFDGATSTRATLSTPLTLASSQAWSVAFWAKRTGSTGERGIVMGNTGNTQNFIYLSENNKCLRFRASNKTINFTYTVDRQIHHYALTVEPGATKTKVSLYLDGAFYAAQEYEGGAFSITAVGQGYTNGSYAFAGTLDDVRLYDNILTADEIAQLYAMRGGPLLWYAFEGDFTDSSGNANDATATGAGLTFTEDLDALRIGDSALALDGNVHLTIATPVTFATGEQWSASFWARRTGIDSQGMILGAATDNYNFIWVTERDNGFRFRSSNNTTVDFTAAKDYLTHHYVLTANGQMCLFTDGVFTQTQHPDN